MKTATDVIIVGGGVVGCSIAYHLRKQQVDVVLLEQGELGSQASQAATGMLAPLKPFIKQNDPYTVLLMMGLKLFPSLVDELEDISGICIEYEQTGTLRVVQTKQTARLEAWMAVWRQAGFEFMLLTGEQIYQYEPGLSPSISAALYNPNEAQLHASQLVEAYAAAATHLGATLYTHEEVGKLLQHNARVTGVQTTQGNLIACNHLILATGAWAGRSGEWLHCALPVRPLRGQSLAIRQPLMPIQHLLFGEGVYLAPKRDGIVIVGATREEAGFEVQTTSEGKNRLYNAAVRFVPTLHACTVENAWAGLRPKTPDARPILGRVPDWDNVLLACGHNGYGVLLSAITGSTIASCIISGEVPEMIRPFSLERFSAIHLDDSEEG